MYLVAETTLYIVTLKKLCWRTSPAGMGIPVSSTSRMTAFPALALTGPVLWR